MPAQWSSRLARLGHVISAAARPGLSRSQPRYSAFISYKHETSTGFAAQLESALKSYAKPYLQRPIRVFRDERHLTPGINLPKLIEDALDASEYMILLASPEAAQSTWVHDELDRWCKHLRRADQLIIVLVSGEIVVDTETKTINWSRTTALPPLLKVHLERVPLYVDMRALHTETDLTLANPAFKRAVNGISARLRNVDPNEMLGEEIRQYRRTVRLRNLTITALTAFALVASTTAYLALRNAAEAKQERNSALARESQLLAAESGRLRTQGRFVEALERALQAMPDFGDPNARPYVPEAEAALTAAVLATPLRYQTRRSGGDLAGVWLDDSGEQILELTYEGRGVVHAPGSAGPGQPLDLRGTTTCRRTVPCEVIFLEVYACIQYHGGMSGGCINPEMLPGYTLGVLLNLCSDRPANAPGEMLLRAATGWDRDALAAAMKRFQNAELEDVSVPVRIPRDSMQQYVAPDFAGQRLAAYHPDERAVRLHDLEGRRPARVLGTFNELIAIRWLGAEDLAVFLPSGVVRLDVRTGARRSFPVGVHATFTRPIPTPDGHWIATTVDGRAILRRSSDDQLVVDGRSAARAARDVAEFDDLSGYSWLVASRAPARAGEQESEGEDEPRAVYVRDVAHEGATKLAGSYQGVVTVFSLDTAHVAVVEAERLTVADRRSGAVVATHALPTSAVREAVLLDVSSYYRTMFPGFFGESPTRDPRLLLVTLDGAAFIYGVGSRQIQQLDLRGARVEGVLVSPLNITLLAEERVEENGFTHALVVPRESDPTPVFLRAPLDVAGYFDFATADAGGRHLILSENKRRLVLFATTQDARVPYCGGTEDNAFFHVERVGEGRAIGVAQRGICLLGFGPSARFVHAEFPIEEFIYSRANRRIVVGHDDWGLYAIGEQESAFHQLPHSTGTIDGVALSSDGHLLFAIVNRDLRAWSLADGTLAYSASPRLATAVQGQRLAGLRRMSRLIDERAEAMVISATEPRIAVATLDTAGAADRVVLADFSTGDSRVIPTSWTYDGLAFSPDGRRLAVLDTASLRVLDARSGSEIYRADGGGIGYLDWIAFARDGTRLIAVPDRDVVQDSANVVRLWKIGRDTTTYELVIEGGVKNAVFSDDGGTVLVQDDAGRSALYESTDGSKRFDLPQFQYIADFGAFADNDRLVYIGDSIDERLRIFDSATGTLLFEYEQEWGSSVNNAFGRPAPFVPVPELNAFLAAGRAGLVKLPYYFDQRRLRSIGARLASTDEGT
jgi:hypothetical protein